MLNDISWTEVTMHASRTNLIYINEVAISARILIMNWVVLISNRSKKKKKEPGKKDGSNGLKVAPSQITLLKYLDYYCKD